MQVFLKTPTGKTVTLEVQNTTTILEFKRMVEKKTGCPASCLRLIWAGKELACSIEDDEEEEKEQRTFDSYGIGNLRGGTDTYEVEPTTTIREFRTEIEKKTGVPPGCQKIVFAGKHLGGQADDDEDERKERTIESYNIQKEATVHVVLRLKGS
ncbi:Polyubiquitin [Fulvia fulva]|uniref:Polyubiquitin n=1 Tax=Passalora fulva TaxID=5499 RepID=A0A9Q8UUN2_PASFU|nr:Polyubiquitin [Fulvia fulva]KAK4617195.1 Polyubiquitin [Fulvia fulva]UJO23111.1 Polyubiquitin [Fulvia fulva]